MQTISIQAQKREIKGKQVKSLRNQEIIPGCINFSDSKKESLLIQIPFSSARKLVGLDKIYLVEVDLDGKKYTTILDEIQINPLNNKIVTINLTEITNETYVKVNMPVSITGISPAVKNNIGILVFTSKYIRVRVKLDTIQSELLLDISKLERVGQSIKISDIQMPASTIVDKSRDYSITLLTIAPPQKTKEVVATADATAEGATATAEGATVAPAKGATVAKGAEGKK